MIFLMESCIWDIWNPYYDILYSPVFMSVIILTNIVEVVINSREVSFDCIHEECVREVKREPEKLSYIYI